MNIKHTVQFINHTISNVNNTTISYYVLIFKRYKKKYFVKNNNKTLQRYGKYAELHYPHLKHYRLLR